MTGGEAKNPLIRDGVSQQQRQVSALATDYAQVDEQDLADFLVFAHNLSQRVVYYDLHNEATGNWRAFFERSTPVQIALISKTRPEIIQHEYNQALRQFLAQWAIAPAAAPSSQTQRLEKLEPILELYAKILETLHTWTLGLAEGTPLKSIIYASVKTSLPRPFKRLQRLEQGLLQSQFAAASAQNRHQRRQNIYHQVAVLFNATELGATSAGDRTLALDMRQLTINRAHAQAELDGIFQPLFQIYLRIIQHAPEALQQSLYVDQSLSPHLALYIVFWEVLKLARVDLNRMTQRHLDFFYREVLRLSEQPAQPDKAHLILELAKFQQAHALDGQTQFSAGNDATGVELFYALNDAIVVNTAQVAELKSIFLHKSHGGSEFLGLHATPIANSFDGQGGEFPKDQAIKAWLPFGDETRPIAPLGLAIASNILLLGEGDRTITFEVTLTLPSPLDVTGLAALNTALPREFQVDFSGETDWISGVIDTVSLTCSGRSTEDYVLTVNVKLSVDIGSVLPYHADLPGSQLATERPVARLMLNHQEHVDLTEAPQEPALYHYLRNAKLNAIAITTKVEGVRNVVLQNDLATLDATKPFPPFGIQPKVGTSFYIGSQEVFQKHLTALNILFDLETDPPLDAEEKIQWQNIYAAYGIDSKFNPGVLTIDSLRERKWHSAGEGVEFSLFCKQKSTQDCDQANNNLKYSINLSSDHLKNLKLNSFVKTPSETAVLEPWTHQSQYGFLRSQLIGDDFRHADYPTVLTRQVLATATQEIIRVSNTESEDSRKKEKTEKRKAVIGAFYKYKTQAPQPETPQPETPQPETPQPETPQPGTPQPETPQPETPQPETPQPETPQPETPQPGTPQPETPQPETPQPETPQPETPQPETPQAETPQPETPQPETPQPETPQPETPQAEAPQPETPQPETPQPETPQPETPQPETPQPETPQPEKTIEIIFQADRHYVELDDAPILPGEPYTPVIKSLQLDYTATATHQDCQLFHLYPFDGVSPLSNALQEPLSPTISLLPKYEQEGELLIGLQNLEPATALCLLFQVAEETANTDLEKTKVIWHYLKDNTWQLLDEHLILDDTSNGLIHSGIVKLAIPADISNTHTTILNPSLHWIKASVDERNQAVCHVISIQAQAVEVTFIDAGNDPNHLAAPLPAETLTKLVVPQPEIKQILHPFPSFGGKTKEQPTQFYTRVSEHLRHKGRAVTIFDYERLVLDRFPEIYKARCINHGEIVDDGALHEIMPGHITLVVIPTLSQRRTINDLQPKVNINLLGEIKSYLGSLSSPWAKLRVVNPLYEQLRVEFCVEFKKPFRNEFTFYQQQLERDIIGFLSPWTVDAGAEIHFGGEIYYSSILNFVEERPYVDYVLNFQLYQDKSNQILKATVSTAQSILVSAPLSRGHVIRPVDPKIPSTRTLTSGRLGYSSLEDLL